MTSAASKILSREALAGALERIRREKKIVGFTSGVFDLLHPGHVDYLEKARAQCDVLVVGVNADASVRANKGSSRPICGHAQRAAVVAGLASVDFVFLFEELNNNQNVSLLKPDIYFKAGDYSKEKLSSAPIVEGYGGKVITVPFVGGYSTTSIVEKIAADAGHGSIEGARPEKKGAIFVDRDGTLIEHVEYLHDPAKVREIPGAFAGLKKLQDVGFRIIMVTNQQGIGMGYFTKEEFFAVNRAVLRLAQTHGVRFDKIYYCPHSLAEQCACRKPAVGLLERAVEELNVDLSRSYVIGDMTSDIQLAHNAACRAVLVKSGRAGSDGLFDAKPDLECAGIAEAAEAIATTSKR